MLETKDGGGVPVITAATQEKQRLRKADKLAKQSVKKTETALPAPPKGFLPRDWAHLDVEKSDRPRVSILTWNVSFERVVNLEFDADSLARSSSRKLSYAEIYSPVRIISE